MSMDPFPLSATRRPVSVAANRTCWESSATSASPASIHWRPVVCRVVAMRRAVKVRSVTTRRDAVNANPVWQGCSAIPAQTITTGSVIMDARVSTFRDEMIFTSICAIKPDYYLFPSQSVFLRMRLLPRPSLHLRSNDRSLRLPTE